LKSSGFYNLLLKH